MCVVCGSDRGRKLVEHFELFYFVRRPKIDTNLNRPLSDQPSAKREVSATLKFFTERPINLQRTGAPYGGVRRVAQRSPKKSTCCVAIFER